MTNTHKLIEARDRIKALAGKRRDAAHRLDMLHQHEAEMTKRSEADGMDIAISVIEDLMAS